MIAAVLDANIIVSATVSNVGIPFQVLQAARTGQYRWITGTPIITEVMRALQRPRVRRRYAITSDDLQVVSELLAKRASRRR